MPARAQAEADNAPPKRGPSAGRRAVFVGIGLAIVCLCLAASAVVFVFGPILAGTQDGMQARWSADDGTPVPARFRYATFPITTDSALPIPLRAVLNSEDERLDPSSTYEVCDDDGTAYLIEKRSFALLPDGLQVSEMIDALNATLQRWGPETDMREANFSVTATDAPPVCDLEIEYRDGHRERFEYRVVDGAPIPLRWSSTDTLGL